MKMKLKKIFSEKQDIKNFFHDRIDKHIEIQGVNLNPVVKCVLVDDLMIVFEKDKK